MGFSGQAGRLVDQFHGAFQKAARQQGNLARDHMAGDHGGRFEADFVGGQEVAQDPAADGDVGGNDVAADFGAVLDADGAGGDGSVCGGDRAKMSCNMCGRIDR